MRFFHGSLTASYLRAGALMTLWLASNHPSTIADQLIPFEREKESSSPEFMMELIPPARSGVEFQIRLPDMVTHSHELLHLSVMGGLAVGDYNDDGWVDFYVPSPQGGGRLFRNLGGLKFLDVTEISGLNDAPVWETGACMVDVDNDGDLDLVVCSYQAPNRVFINTGKTSSGDVRFVEKAAELGLNFNGASMQMAFADMDLDGDLDAYLATTAAPPPAGVEFRVEFEGERPVIPEELREYWELLYLPGEKAHRTEAGQYDRLYRNDNGTFVEIAESAGIDGAYFTLSAMWLDFNQDGWPDIYAANDYLGPDRLYINQRDGTFRNAIQDYLPHTPWSSMGMAYGDLNRDGRLDFIATDMLGSTHYRRNVMLGESSRMEWFFDFSKPPQYSRNAVYLNSGADRFFEVAWQTGMQATDWTWAPLIEDLDGDGWEDVFFTNGMLRDVQHSDLGSYADRTFGGGSRAWAEFWSSQPMLTERNRAFQNQGQLRFKPVETSWGLDLKGVSFASAAADLDRDGDPDLIVVHADRPVSIYENHSAEAHRLKVQLKGTRSNHFGIGSTVTIQHGTTQQSRYLSQSRGWLSGGLNELNFGLGQDDSVDRLEIQWPDGAKQVLENLPANHLVEVVEIGHPKTEQASSVTKGSTRFKPDHQHSFPELWPSQLAAIPEQPLASHARLQGMVVTAWEDVNLDGLTDVFIGGGLGVSGRLAIQNKDGSFSESRSDVFANHSAEADAGAVFHDWNRDGFPDLFVARYALRPTTASGKSGHSLYLNDQKGGWITNTGAALPDSQTQANTLAAGDMDQDGDLDLFIGGSALLGKFPVPTESQLWVWDRDRFIDQTPAEFSGLGMIQDARWCDLNQDQRLDLILAEAFGPVRIFLNLDTGWKEITRQSGLAETISWWRSVEVADLDQDGDLDLIAGSVGRNTKYQARQDNLQALLFGVLGAQKRLLALEAYQEGQSIFLHAGFEAVSRILPGLRSRFKNFHEWSQANAQQVFDPEEMKNLKVKIWNSMDSGIWEQIAPLKFKFHPLPALAQVSPVNDIAIGDFNQDGRPDLALAQNDASQQPGNFRMDGGLSLILENTGSLNFEALYPDQSGISIPGEAREVHWLDLESDHKKELIFVIREEQIIPFRSQSVISLD